jgi:hypothetical protein
MDEKEKTSRIRELNDTFRKVLSVLPGSTPNKVVLTRGVASLGPDRMLEIFQRVREFNDFTEDNDPHGEHDFGSFVLGDQAINWKIDYYDSAMEYGSEEPWNAAKTVRVLTIMLVEES